ncbi:MAG: cyclopropane-fatty-acyl-phospholipid synthase family protein [Pirellulaceae bacterium]
MASSTLVAGLLRGIEAGWIPEWVTRWGIRQLCAKRLATLRARGFEAGRDLDDRFYQQSIDGPIALVPEKANEQHYEVPAAAFEMMLGPHRKYSSCYWEPGVRDLEEAEHRSLELSCEHAGLVDGQDILELGCGWGSLTLFMAQRYPHSHITAVSNSGSQREFIMARARELGVADRLRIVTGDVSTLQLDGTFDRIVSIEMFEHMRNYRQLMKKCRAWLRADRALFVHVFCHRHFTYPFETEGAENWMGRYFFSGGIMPSDDWLLRFQEDLVCTRQWRWSGEHYQKTAEAWLDNMTRNRSRLEALFADVYPGQSPAQWYRRWRMLYLAGAEMFGLRDGAEWYVSHYRFEPRGSSQELTREGDEHAWEHGTPRGELVG